MSIEELNGQNEKMKYLKDENQVLDLGESSTRFGGIKYMSWGNQVQDLWK